MHAVPRSGQLTDVIKRLAERVPLLARPLLQPPDRRLGRPAPLPAARWSRAAARSASASCHRSRRSAASAITTSRLSDAAPSPPRSAPRPPCRRLPLGRAPATRAMAVLAGEARRSGVGRRESRASAAAGVCRRAGVGRVRERSAGSRKAAERTSLIRVLSLEVRRRGRRRRGASPVGTRRSGSASRRM